MLDQTTSVLSNLGILLNTCAPVLFFEPSGFEACLDRIFQRKNHIPEKYLHAIMMSLLQVSERIASE